MATIWFATYRLQLHSGFPLSAAEKILPYLRDLGISHVYLSPCLQAAPKSLHGYDGADPTIISADLGGEEAWDSFHEAARRTGLGVLLDIVPNHMSTDGANPWWSDVLNHGPFSKYAESFDIFPFENEGCWKINLCVLGEPYGESLQKGQFSLAINSGLPRLIYGDHSWPLCPSTWRPFFRSAQHDSQLWDLEQLRLRARPRAEEIAQYRDLSNLLVVAMREESAGEELRETLRAISRDPEGLHRIIDKQFYRLAWWKLEGEIVNYRRFFNVGTLIGLRMDSETVFAASHVRIAKMIEAGEISGLRVDHPDGLRDPKGYLVRLRELFPHGRIYVEKILDAEETLPDDWPVDGTVGYEFLSKVNRLWMDENKVNAMTSIYADFTGHPVNYSDLVREKKLTVLNKYFGADLERLVHLSEIISQERWTTRDLSREELKRAIALVIISPTVYRTYLTAEDAASSPVDEKIIKDGVAASRTQGDDIEPSIFDFLGALLTRELVGPNEAEFIARWQQLTPAVMAKGAEDTTFYCYDRLVSCNEVGAQPSLYGISAENFHQFCSHLYSRWPDNLLTTSTHDNKRSEDVRARISVLSEIPEEWDAALQRWSALNQPHWQGRKSDRHVEYLLYQTLIGAWPISPQRICEYLLKACREAKIHTSWHDPCPSYEEGLRGFTEGILASEEFIRELAAFVSPLVLPGRINSLAQTLIKLTAPGTPDIYQGSELWDLSLVDPDNRRPVDFVRRLGLLENCGRAEALSDWESGLPKLWLIHRVLQIRRTHSACFAEPPVPSTARGVRLAHLLLFQRGENILVVVPRFTLTLQGDWADTTIVLPAGRWQNVFTETCHEGEISPAALFEDFPVSLLVRASKVTPSA